MPAVDNTADQLVAAVRRDCFQAANDDNWTSAKILGVADDCTLKIAAALKKLKQDWFQEDFDVTLVADQKEYAAPEAAMWSSVENVFLVDKSTGRIVAELANASSSNRAIYQSPNDGASGIPGAVWLNQYALVCEPAPDDSAVTAYSMTVSAYRRPGQLVLETEIARVTAVNSVTQTLTINARPSTWETDAYTSGTPYRVDLYSRTLPNAQLLRNRTVTAPSATALTFSPSITAAEFATISVGDVVAMKNTTWYPDMPPEAVPHLRSMVQKTILTAQTDAAALQAYLAEKADEAALFIKGMSNRHDGKPRKLSLRNAAGARFMMRARRY